MSCIPGRLSIAPSEVLPAPGVSRQMDFAQGPLPIQLLPSERSFYCSYPWALNTYPTVEELTKHLSDEFRRVNTTTEAWQLAEVMTNIFMFSCAITNEVDDYLAGKQYGFAKLSKFPLGGVAVRVAEKAAAGVRGVQHWRLRELRAWRQKWEGAVSEYLKIFVVARPNTTALRKAETQITNLLEIRLPAKLLARRLRSPAFFHVRELTHFDVLQLGDKFVAAFPDRNSPIVLVGLRTAGSYFGPLLRAYLSANGYTDVKLITTRPRGAQSRSEKVGLAQFASEGRMAVIVDESLRWERNGERYKNA